RIQFLNKRKRNADDYTVVEEVAEDSEVSSKDMYEYKYLASDDGHVDIDHHNPLV
ncbi:MAG: hypothetical protein HGB19_10155, partial [Chlorobiales bacterium]|nr:hypothetical protein [Chlorobiales bacterium]